MKIFKIFKNTIFISVLLALVIGLTAGAFSAVYLAPVLKQGLGIDKQEKEQPDLFLEPSEDEKEKKDQHKGQEERQKQSIPDVVEEASPAVVSIIVSKYVPVVERYYYNPFEEFDQFFEDSPTVQIPGYRKKGEELQEVGGGTGFIVTSNGYIVTNKHVVYDAEAEYTVLTNDGEKHPAPVVARDPIHDIAILKISADNLPTIELGNSDNLRIGQTVIAIGNALGEFRNTVSAGVVSGLSRTITASGTGASEQLREVIQTDAAINQGNSGGPLLNLYGQVVGMNTAMAQGAENIGFAIPVNKVKKVVNDIKTKGKISYPFLGVRYITITEAIAKNNNLPVDYGALIVRGESAAEPAIMPGSVADKAGLVENDIILEIDGKKITSDSPLQSIILDYEPDDKVILKVLHHGEEKIIDLKLEEWSGN